MDSSEVNKTEVVILMFKFFILFQIIAYVSCLLSVTKLDWANILLLAVPMVYILVNIFITKLPKIKYGPGMYFWHVILFLKYFVMPLYIVYSGHRQTIGVTVAEESFIYGAFLLFYEMIWIYGLYFCFYYRLAYTSMKKLISYNVPLIIPKNFKKIFVSTLFLGLCLLLLYPNNFISIKAFDILGFAPENEIDEETSSLGSVIVRFWKDFSFIIFLIYIGNKYLKKKSKIYIIYFILLILLYLFFNLSTSRWTLLFLVISASYIGYLLFGKRILRFLYVLASMLIFLLFSITVYKFSWYFESNEGNIITLLFGQLQSYFSGPNLLAQAVDMNNQFYIANNISISTFFNDILGSIPLLSKLVNQSDRINAYFNAYVLGFNGNLSQIIPMTGIGYTYIGLLFSPLFTIIFTSIGMYFDYKSQIVSNLFYKYVYICMALWFLTALLMNTQIIVGNVIIHSLSLLVFYKLFLFKISYNGK